jgi:hypothetical protein
MNLLRPDDFTRLPRSYRVFTLGRDNEPWRVEDVLRSTPFTPDPERAELAWLIASRGYYAEQAGLVAAATLAAATDDTMLRFSLATAASDEARHADAFYAYAAAVGGDIDECQRELDPLQDGLTALPYLGKALVHTMLEGFAADEFVLLRQVFADDPLGRLYHHVRRDEIRHVAIGLDYLARSSRTGADRDRWHAHGGQWLEIGMELTNLAGMCGWLAGMVGQDPADLESWFLRRHLARLKAAGITHAKGGDST